MLRSVILAICALLMMTNESVQAEFELDLHGKVDVGPTLLDVDILESGKTVKTLHMKGIKGDVTLIVWKGACIKSGFLWSEGHGRLSTCYLGVGQYIPVTEELLVTPSVGVAFSYLHTQVDLEALGLFSLKEKFHSSSPYVAVEFCYKLAEKWTLLGLFQYAWSRTHTTIKPFVSDKSTSQGPNYALGVEYSFLPNWSLNFGVGYNITLSKEKHGIRGKGAKLGLAYYF